MTLRTLLFALLMGVRDDPPLEPLPPAPPIDVYVMMDLQSRLIRVANSCEELYKFADAYGFHEYLILRYEQVDLGECEPAKEPHGEN